MDSSRIIRIGVGGVMALVGLLGVGIGTLAMIDPVGAKASDDANPFGTPPTRLSSFLLTVVFLAMASVGAFLIAYRRKTSDSN